MPVRPKHPCSHPGCGTLVKTRYCDQHTRAAERQRDRRRGSSTARGYGYDWQQLRAAKVQANPLCELCIKTGRIALTEEVDHIIPIEQRPDLRLAWDNLQSLCGPCHRAKTRGEWDSAARPRGLKPSAVPLTIVCGPPGSGKTTWAKAHASQNDLVIDLDEIKQGLEPGRDTYGEGGDLLRRALVERNKLLRSLASKPARPRQAFFTIGAPLATDRRWWRAQLDPVRLIVLEVEIGECESRITASNRTVWAKERSIVAAREWWMRYSPQTEDEILSPAANASTPPRPHALARGPAATGA